MIPCFNQAGFLADAIESVLAQTYGEHEIIVIDDGSTDNTAEVAARYNEVQCFRQDNRGLADARNEGLARSEGEFVAFLDADDKLLPSALEVAVEQLIAHPNCAYVSGHHRLIDVQGTLLQQWTRSLVSGDRYMLLLQGNYIGMPAAVLYRRDVFDIVGVFDQTLEASEDYDLYLRIARTFDVCDHSGIVAEYRRHGEAMTDQPLRMLRASLQVLWAERPFTEGVAAYEQARRTGIRHWREYYGGLAAERIAATFYDGQLLSGFRQLLSLAPLAPLQALAALRTVRGYRPGNRRDGLIRCFW